MNMTVTNGSNDGTNDNFISLCKELGRRINSTENALLCVRAYRAYLTEHPDTAHGKGNKSDRDASEKSFRHAAAEASGVSLSTIDALLQAGKAIEKLPDDLKTALASSSLGIRMLRKLAPKKFDSNRETLIKNYIEEEKSNPEVARANLEAALGNATSTRPATKKTQSTNAPGESNKGTQTEEPQIVEHTLATGEDFEMKVGGYCVRVTIDVQADGRVHVRAVACQGEVKEVEKVLATQEEAQSQEEESAPASGEQESKAA